MRYSRELVRVAAYLAILVGGCKESGGPNEGDPSGGTDTDAASSTETGGESSGSGTGGNSTGGDTDDETTGSKAETCEELEAASLDVLETACATCHGEGGSAPGGLDYITDVDQLIASGQIFPGGSDQSEIFTRMEAGQMPPSGVEPRPSDIDIDNVQRWIDECMGPEQCEPSTYIGVPDLIAIVDADISTLPGSDRPFTRYFTLTHLYDNGLCGDELALHRSALSKAVNAMSNGPIVVPPVAIDTEQTVFRIDLRDYEWTQATWTQLVAEDPYALSFFDETADHIVGETQTGVPIVRADWFASVATRPPLYHVMLDLPDTLGELEDTLGIDLDIDILLRDVQRSGFLESGVSVNNRLIERHELPGGNNRYLWISYDFASNSGFSNLFSHPVDFQPAGSELIYTLPNGMNGYMIVNSAGTRLDEAPDDIVTDPLQPNGNVVNGLSCMSCHAQGIILREDELGPHVATSDSFDFETKATVAALHPDSNSFEARQTADRDQYLNYLESADLSDPLGQDPVNSVFAAYSGVVNLSVAAAELGVSSDALLAQLDSLPTDMQALDSGAVSREVFEENFADCACALDLGIEVACDGQPPTGECCEPAPDQNGAGCGDPQCESIVCEQAPECCQFAWSDLCASIARETCDVCGAVFPGPEPQ
jgi:serine/threonine-protein kinase